MYLRTPLRKCFSPFNDDLGDRTDTVEKQIHDYATAYNELVDAHHAQAEVLERITTKLTDLEDRSRRNNLKSRGIPESIPSAELPAYLQRLFKSLAPSLTELDLMIDRAHRIFKPSHVPEDKPQDVLTRLHFFQAKECIFLEARKAPALQEPFASLKIYADISAATAQKQK